MGKTITFEYFENKEEERRIERARTRRDFYNLSLDKKVAVVIMFGLIMKAINRCRKDKEKIK